MKIKLISAVIVSLLVLLFSAQALARGTYSLYGPGGTYVPPYNNDVFIIESFSDIVNRVLPSVCMVISNPEEENLPFSNNQPQPSQRAPNSEAGMMGTCFIVSYKNKKFVITNHHVVDSIKNTTKIIFYGNFKTYPAIIVGKDKMSDIAVLKMSTLEGQTRIRNIKELQWGNSNNMRQGDDAWAVGHPMQQLWSVSKGIISYIGRRIHNIRQELIQSDVAINSGNSGGPLLNMKGEVIGVNTFIASRQNGGQLGVNFSVTSNLAKRVMKQLIDTGVVKSPKIGVLFQIDHDKGLFIIKAVEPGSPTEAAGIQDDDLIVKINGHDIYLIDDMGKALDHVLPGDEIEIVILRGDEIIKRIVKTTKIDDN